MLLLGAELEEALQAGAGVLRPLAFVAVRQKQHDAGGLLPLGFGGDDELVDDHLGSVGEIAELRFPEDQHVRGHQAVAVVETEHGGLAEQASCKRGSVAAPSPRCCSGK